MDTDMYVVVEDYAGHRNPVAVLDDEELAKRYVTAMNDTTDGWHDYWVERVDFIDEEGVELVEPKEISDEEYEQEKAAMEADDHWAEHGYTY